MPTMISAAATTKRYFRSCRLGNLKRRRALDLAVISQRLLLDIHTNTSCDGNQFLLPKQFARSSSSTTTVGAKSAYRFNSSVAAASAETFLPESHSVSYRTESIANNYDDVASTEMVYDNVPEVEKSRLRHMRNVGIFAHVDAGKTTVTERMLALAGIVPRAGSVDDGNTVTDYLPQERERGITIQSAAIRFPWAFHNAQAGEWANDRVSIALIDTPGHVDFSVEVNRSVAVLDGAVLVVDAAAGVQAQTQTVWRAMTRPSFNNHQTAKAALVDKKEEEDDYRSSRHSREDHFHEPLPCVALINKMDKIGSDFHMAVQSLRDKLPGANPMPIQLPVFKTSLKRSSSTGADDSENILHGLAAAYDKSRACHSDDFMGILDLIHMRVVVWPDHKTCQNDISIVENCIPTVIPLWTDDHELLYPDCSISQVAVRARTDLVGAMADVDEGIEELYLNEQDPTTADLRQAIRRATISHRILPVMAAAAVQGKGIEPCLDAIADFLPSPIDRMSPSLTNLREKQKKRPVNEFPLSEIDRRNQVTLGHCFHPTLLALAFKVLHMKGRGGSGDGRVVFARVYSGKIRCRDVVHIVRPPAPGEQSQAPRTERVGGMLELTHFCNLENGEALSGDVCALVGLKSVVTGDTIMMAPPRGKKPKGESVEYAYCAGVTSPKPVLTVKLEAESTSEQTRLIEALTLMSIEDPSLVVKESDSYTLLSGLGELHIDVTLDRIRREHGIAVIAGTPSVAYRETVTATMETDGMVNFERTIGDTRMQASIHLKLEPLLEWENEEDRCQILSDPSVTLSPAVLTYLGFEGFNGSLVDLENKSPVVKSLLEGCRGALKRGPTGYGMANLTCQVVQIDAENGVAGMQAMPGALRAAAAHVVHMLMSEGKGNCCVLEPKMSLELSVPNEMVGAVLSDLTGRRGTVDDVFLGDVASVDRKALVRGEVPLIEILGYANSLRSLTGGEASFTSEYKGHSPCAK